MYRKRGCSNTPASQENIVDLLTHIVEHVSNHGVVAEQQPIEERNDEVGEPDGESDQTGNSDENVEGEGTNSETGSRYLQRSRRTPANFRPAFLATSVNEPGSVRETRRSREEKHWEEAIRSELFIERTWHVGTFYSSRKD